MSGSSRGRVNVSQSFYVRDWARRNHFQLPATNSQSQTPLSQFLSRMTLSRHLSIASSSTPPTITNTSVPVQGSPLVPGPSQQASLFQHARHVDIQGGQFTNEWAPHVVNNVTIHVPGMVWFNPICCWRQIQSGLQPENGGEHPVPMIQSTSTLHQVCVHPFILKVDSWLTCNLNLPRMKKAWMKWKSPIQIQCLVKMEIV